MKRFNRLIILTVTVFLVLIALANALFFFSDKRRDRLYIIESNRLMDSYSTGEEPSRGDIDACRSITGVALLDPAAADVTEQQAFFEGGEYFIRPLYRDGALLGYVRFDVADGETAANSLLMWWNVVFVLALLASVALLLYIKGEIIGPMQSFLTLPEALAKGNFDTPIRARSSRFFDRFLWGLDMLRETMLAERQRALSLEKEKSQNTLSLSHDIKTPLSAIALCAKALREGLYTDEHRRLELLQRIEDRTMEIQSLVLRLQENASEDMLDLTVQTEDFYLDEVVERIRDAYEWRMQLTGVRFAIQRHVNCMLQGDAERVYEALCNLMENAMKYGDGAGVSIEFSRQDNCQLITVVNTGNSLRDSEVVHMFDSFWRGPNAEGRPGNGLGLFIARRLCVNMGGEAFAEARDGRMQVSLVLPVS